MNGDIAYLTYNFGEDHSTWTQVLESGVIAVDVSDPTNPQKIAVNPDLDAASSITAVGDLVFVTDSSRGLFILGEPKTKINVMQDCNFSCLRELYQHHGPRYILSLCSHRLSNQVILGE